MRFSSILITLKEVGISFRPPFGSVASAIGYGTREAESMVACPAMRTEVRKAKVVSAWCGHANHLRWANAPI